MYSPHDIGAGAEQQGPQQPQQQQQHQHQHHPHHVHNRHQQHPTTYTAANPPPSSAFSHHQASFASPVYALDPHAASPQHLHPGARHPTSSAALKPHTSQRPAESTAGAMPPPPPGATSPRPRSVTPSTAIAGHRPIDREPPSQNVTKENIADAFVQFILYCNPTFPLSIDTAALKAAFASPPKSEGNAFDMYLLFDLVRKKNHDEIKTWNQLALELGVEAPDSSKGQSVQKVQQYAVRLKRWMNALHVNAFFDFLTNTPNPYFNEIPAPGDPFPTERRDRVLAEDDLALRALDPSFRPKRGRRRNSETDQDDSISPGTRPARQPDALNSGVPMSAIPSSAHPDHYQDPWGAMASAVTPQSLAPWSGRPSAPPSAVSTSTPSSLRWQFGTQSQTPSTPHPLSATVEEAEGWPRSANTPSSRKRRRHGPAVSSAWPSNNTPGAKPRGRPPSNRNVQDGPFGTFPADPAAERPTSQPPSATSEKPSSSIEQGDTQMSAPILTPLSAQSEGSGRPHRLSLQVPPHIGGPVRLASPPALFVNGERKESETKSDSDDPCRIMLANTMQQHAPQMPTPQSGQSLNSGRMVGKMAASPSGRQIPGFAFEALKRVLASDLLRATLVGRRNRLSGEEARRLADAVLQRMGIPREDSEGTQDDIARCTAASWLGVGYQLNVPLGPATGHNKRITVTRFRADAHGYEELTHADDDAGGAEGVREVFDLAWDVSLGGCIGRFEMKGLSPADGRPSRPPAPALRHDALVQRTLDTTRLLAQEGWLEQSMREVARATRLVDGDERINWKAKYEAMEFSARIVKGEVERERERTLQKVLDALL